MNERFFDLKKDRQDRIINGAMRIFAENGYRHASTDEMVAAAGISKGLLFHYFKSKKGTWMFLYEYCTRYMLIEMREAERRHGCDFFDMYRQLVKADESVLRRYPWVPIFLKRADREFDLIKADLTGPADEIRDHQDPQLLVVPSAHLARPAHHRRLFASKKLLHSCFPPAFRFSISLLM